VLWLLGVTSALSHAMAVEMAEIHRFISSWRRKRRTETEWRRRTTDVNIKIEQCIEKLKIGKFVLSFFFTYVIFGLEEILIPIGNPVEENAFNNNKNQSVFKTRFQHQ